jgi:predicted nucleic-acid-binding Zn-ribbon protein
VETLTCPTCGEHTWGGFANAAINITAEANSKAAVGTVRALLAVCGRCGFVAMFDREVIEHQ